MPLTTVIAVQGIIEHDTEIPLDPFIETASMIVDRVLVPVKDDDGSLYYNNTQLEVIERWLAAHFYAVRDPRTAFEGVGKVQASFESKVGLNLNNTRYGQAALGLDTSGTLAALQKQAEEGGKLKPQVVWLGTERE
jgi:hypothetical protein